MTPTYLKLVHGAASGLVSAMLIDLHAWSKTQDPFDWKLALKRWAVGAFTGLTVAGGFVGVEGG